MIATAGWLPNRSLAALDQGLPPLARTRIDELSAGRLSARRGFWLLRRRSTKRGTPPLLAGCDESPAADVQASDAGIARPSNAKVRCRRADCPRLCRLNAAAESSRRERKVRPADLGPRTTIRFSWGCVAFVPLAYARGSRGEYPPHARPFARRVGFGISSLHRPAGTQNEARGSADFPRIASWALIATRLRRFTSAAAVASL